MLILALLVVQPSPAHAYDQATWDELTKKEEPFLRTLRTRPLEIPAKGKCTQKVVTYFDPKYSYGVYVPKDYDPRKPWPVVFFTPPGGLGWQYCMMYQTYAEQLGWILVAANEASAVSTRDTVDNNICMVKDVLARFNVHKEMCITAGFSTGSRVAGMLAFADKDFPWMMGTIQIGAAQGPFPPLGGKQVYLIAGKLDPNYAEMQSWDKACRKAGCRVEKIEWNAGHQMASGQMFYQALKWQTDTFLQSSPDTSEATQQKRQDYVQNLIDLARRGDAGNKVIDIYVRYREAYNAGTTIPCGLKMTKQALALERRMNELARYPEVKKEIDCFTELQALIERVQRQQEQKALKNEEAAAPVPAPADPAPPAAAADPAAPPPPPPAFAVPPAPPETPVTPPATPPPAAPPAAPATPEADAPAPKTAPTVPASNAPKPAAEDDDLIPEGDDLLPEELERRKQAAKAEVDAAAAKIKAQAEAEKKAAVEAKQAQIPPWEAAQALAKKYPGTPSSLRAMQLAIEWQQQFQAIKLNKQQLLMMGQALPTPDPWPADQGLQPSAPAAK